MTRFRARNSALALTLAMLCGCQSSNWLQDRGAVADGGILPAAHSEPKRQPGLFAGPKDDVQKLLKQATEFDNANRSNPQDRESLRSARLAYERILQLHPSTQSQAYALHRLGTIADREGRFQEAERDYLAAQHLSPSSPEIYSDLGYSYLLQNRLVESEEALQQALQLNPQQPRARVNLGIVMARAGQLEQAYELIRSERGDADARAILAQYGRAPAPETSASGLAARDTPRKAIEQRQVAGNSGISDAQNGPPPNEATRSLQEAILRNRMLNPGKTPATQVSQSNSPWAEQDPLSARRAADERAFGGLNQQLREVDRFADRDRSQAQPLTVPSTGQEREPAADSQLALRQQNQALQMKQQYANDFAPQRRPEMNSQPLYIEPVTADRHTMIPDDRNTGTFADGRQLRAPRVNSQFDGRSYGDARQRQVSPETAQREEWERVRHQAARLGFEAGGGALFPTDQDDPSVADQATGTNPGMSRQTGYNAPQSNGFVHPQLQYADGQDRRADDRIEPDAELQMLHDQQRLIQEQIAQKRRQVEQLRGRPQVDLLPPSSGE